MSTSAEARGHVEPGGPSWVLDLGPATVRKCSVSEMDNNVYLLTCTATGDRLLVDAADDAERIWALLAEDAGSGGGDRLGQVLTTHRQAAHEGTCL